MNTTSPERLSATNPRTSVLFVCLGNICRSPLAKGVFLHMAVTRGVSQRFLVDSCGTGSWHEGNGADPRTILVAARHGVHFDHVARQVAVPADFERFDLIVPMDLRNYEDLLSMGAPQRKVHLLRSFDPVLEGASKRPMIVPDPYSGSDDGFQRVYEMVWSACEGLLEHLLRQPPALTPDHRIKPR